MPNTKWMMKLMARTDVHTHSQRSYNMSQIRGTNTKSELILRYALWKHGFRYRISTKMHGRPDIIFSKAMVAIFVDGCFWHACPEHLVWPKNNASFWKTKILSNKRRDKVVTNALKREGWRVLRLWEHEVLTNLDSCIAQVASLLTEGK